MKSIIQINAIKETEKESGISLCEMR